MFHFLEQTGDKKIAYLAFQSHAASKPQMGFGPRGSGSRIWSQPSPLCCASFEVHRPSLSLFWKGFSDYLQPLWSLPDCTHPPLRAPHYFFMTVAACESEQHASVARGTESPQFAHGLLVSHGVPRERAESEEILWSK